MERPSRPRCSIATAATTRIDIQCSCPTAAGSCISRGRPQRSGGGFSSGRLTGRRPYQGFRSCSRILRRYTCRRSPDEVPAISSMCGTAGSRSERSTRLAAALAGDAHRLDAEAGGPTPYHPSMVSASADVIAFAASPIPFGAHLGFVGRNGDGFQLRPESEVQNWPRLSPDGLWLTRQRIDVVRGNPDIWVEDIARGTGARVTTDPAAEMLPVWSPDGARIAYLVSDAPPRTPGRLKLNVAARDGTGVVQTLSCPDAYCEPTDWTPDGRHLVVNVRGEKGAADVWAVATVPGGATHAILDAPYTERDARISPNGRWIAYVSEESGRPEVAARELSSRRFPPGAVRDRRRSAGLAP